MKLQVLSLCLLTFTNVLCHDNAIKNVKQPTVSKESKKEKRGIGQYNPLGWGGYGVGTYGVPATPVQGVTVLQTNPQVPYPVPYDRPVPYPVSYDRPVPYPVHVDRPLPYPVHVDRPLPYPVHVEKPLPYPVHVDRPVPYPVQVEKPLPYPVHVDRPYPVHVDRPVPYAVPVPVNVQQPVLWQRSSNNFIGMPVYNGGNQAGYQYSPYPSGYSIGVNHALIGLGGKSQNGVASINSVAGSLLGNAFNIMQGVMSPGGSISGYAVGHNNYLGPKTTGFTTNINK